MQLNPAYFEDTSVHYYVPKPSGPQSLLYYPVSVGYLDCKPQYHTLRNTFSSYLLIVMLTGSLSWQTRHNRGTVRAGQVLLLDCNSPHEYAAQGKCSFTFVHFDGAQSKALYEEIERSGGNQFAVPSVSAMHETIGEMINAMQQDRRINEATASAALYGMLMQLMEHAGASSAGTVGNTLVDRSIDYIQSHLHEHLTVDAVASHAGYSTSYFSHLFSDETGMSPYQFIVKSRVEMAQQLLQTTQMTVQDVAFQTGFNSTANFCYTFRRLSGVSPQEYRKRPL